MTTASHFHDLIELLGAARADPRMRYLPPDEEFADAQKFVTSPAHVEQPALVDFGRTLVQRNLFRLPFLRVLVELQEAAAFSFLHCEQIIGWGFDKNRKRVPRAPDDVQVVLSFLWITRAERMKLNWVPALFVVDMSTPEVSDFDGIFCGEDSRVDEKSVWAVHEMVTRLLFGFVSLINSRSAIVTAQLVPERLNKARARRGKPPIYEYRTIELPAPEPTARADLGGTHASPRLHWRRGHYRRWKTGVVPISPCLVGAAELGAVAHLYKALKG